MAVLYIGDTLVGSFSGDFPYEVVSSLPTASAATAGAIYVVTGESSSTLYMTAESSGGYSWVQVGTLSASVEAITNAEIDSLFD